MLKQTLAKVLVPLVILSSAFSVNANEYTITFDDEPNVHSPEAGTGNNWGTIIDDEYTSAGSVGSVGGVDVDFWVQYTDQNNDFVNGNSFDKNNADGFLTLFNTTYETGGDDDLVFDEPGEDKGNLAIIHERNIDCETVDQLDGCTNPDDRYHTPANSDWNSNPNGGFVFVQFSQPVNLHSIDLADMESGASQLGGFRFYDAAGVTVQNGTDNWTMMTTENAGDGSYQTQSFDFAKSVTTMVIRMQGSGGFKNLSFSKVPEPTTLAIFGLGLIALVARRKAIK